MGIVEGLTEFLPISSTGHLILAGSLLGFADEKVKVFEIAIQSGAILAVMIVYRERLAATLAGLGSDAQARRFALNVAIAFVPAVLLGLAVRQGDQGAPVHADRGRDDLHPRRLRHPLGRAAQGARRGIDSVDAMRPIDALGVGLCQCFALIPGTSRSGATIIGGMLLGLSRGAATEFSFFLSIPTLLGAGAYSLWKERALLSAADLPLFARRPASSRSSPRGSACAGCCATSSTHDLRAVRLVPDRLRLIVARRRPGAASSSGKADGAAAMPARLRPRLREDQVPHAVAAVERRAARTWSAAGDGGPRREAVAGGVDEQRLGRRARRASARRRAASRSRSAACAPGGEPARRAGARRAAGSGAACGAASCARGRERRRGRRRATPARSCARAPRPRRAGRCARCAGRPRRSAAAARRRRADGPRCRGSRLRRRAAAIAAVALPMPKPISTTSGATRPNTAAKSTGRAANGNTKRGASVASARAWPGPMRPARTTKLRMRGADAFEPSSAGAESLPRTIAVAAGDLTVVSRADFALCEGLAGGRTRDSEGTSPACTAAPIRPVWESATPGRCERRMRWRR